MVDIHMDADDIEESRLRQILSRIDPDAVVRIRPVGEIGADGWRMLGAASLRSIAPATMTVSVNAGRGHSSHSG